MTVAAPAADTNQGPTFSKRLLGLVKLVKGMDDAALRDIEILDSVTDDHVQPHMMPSTTQVDSGPAQAMRGGQADTQVAAHSTLEAQQGLTRMYNEFDSRLSAMGKSVLDGQTKLDQILKAIKPMGALVLALAKAEDDDKDGEKAAEKARLDAEAVTKSKDDALAVPLRKARIAVRKAEGAEDDDEKKDFMEKAATAVTAFADAVSKAEDDADSDDDEKRSEKARADLKTLRKALKELAKAPEQAVAAVVAPAAAAATPITKTDLVTELEKFAKGQNVTMQQLIATMAQTPAAGNGEPPVFMKALQDSSAEDMDVRIAKAEGDGTLSSGEVMKARSILSRLQLAKAGVMDMSLVAAEVQAAAPSVQRLFSLQVAAAA